MTLLATVTPDTIVYYATFLGIFKFKRIYRLVVNFNDQEVWHCKKLRKEYTHIELFHISDRELMWGRK